MLTNEKVERKYKLVITRRFTKDFRKLDFQVQERILKALEKLEENPWLGEKVFAQQTGTYRYRVGDYRIRYDISGEEIVLLKVRHRKEVYR